MRNSSLNLRKFERICSKRLHIVPKPGIAYRDDNGQRRYLPITVASALQCPKCHGGEPLDERLIQKRPNFLQIS